ncbi:MAG: hypothetical protein ACTSR8_19635 [Promethearchaeota archaeon]
MEDFIKLLNAFSSEIAYNILNLYSNKSGLTLTNTSNELGKEISTSTIRDHLNRLIEAHLIYKKEKQYYLSNFGSFILKNLRSLEVFNKARQIFGQIPAELIPSEFIQKLVFDLKDIEVESDGWQIMYISSNILNQINQDIGIQGNELKILGWKKSLSLSIEIIQKNLTKVSFDITSMNKFLEDLNFELITDQTFIDEINKNKQLREMVDQTSIKNRIFVCEKVENFSFTLFKYNKIIQFFLNEENKQFLIEDNDPAVEFFDSVFQYYLNQSNPLLKYLK